MEKVRMIEVVIGLLCAIAVASGVLSFFWIADLALVFPALGPPVAGLAVWRNRILKGAREDSEAA
jgi:hypothetical protein